MPTPLLRTDLPLPNKREGKVRDVYDCTTVSGQDAVLLVATDRLSAFDVVMPNAPAGKGIVLTQMAAFWFALVRKNLGHLIADHLISTDPADIAGLDDAQRAQLAGRIMICRKATVVPVECVARGYLIGGGWKDYQASGHVCGIPLPDGLQQAQQLARPIFTPATKAEVGDHDENIDFIRMAEITGVEQAEQLRDITLTVYNLGRDWAAERGILLADTKLEFGTREDGTLMLIDEVLTPDSSRYWPADQYAVGTSPQSFDKQFVRDWLENEVTAGRWGKTAPGPALPQDVLDGTMAKYLEAFERLTGNKLDLDGFLN